MDKDTREAQLYLLRANADSFQFVEEAEADWETVLKYSGSISPSSAIEAYKVYLRKRYVEMDLLRELDDPSSEELKDEIVNGDVLELKVGIPALAYSEEPVPISLWVGKDTLVLLKVEIDKFFLGIPSGKMAKAAKRKYWLPLDLIYIKLT